MSKFDQLRALREAMFAQSVTKPAQNIVTPSHDIVTPPVKAGRPRRFATNAERQSAYRERKRNA